MKFLEVQLQTGADSLLALVEFYGAGLGFPRRGEAAFRIGETELEFVPAPGDPFYHFALLIPGNRFDAACAWIRSRAELLPYGETGEHVFGFDNWQALACYFHDPAGNIVELIAHHGIGENESAGDLEPGELLGLSELGLVGNPRTMATELEQLDLHIWDGTVHEPDRLTFVGEKARTLILSPEGRGWLPTGRPAEPHAVVSTLSPPYGDEVTVGGLHRIRRSHTSL